MNDLNGQSQWWDFDPSEVPVPLGIDDQAVVEAAEQEVALAHDSLAREETQPIHLPVTTRLRGDSLKLAIAVLLLGCLAMFSAGFRSGSVPAKPALDDRPAETPRTTSVADVTLSTPPQLSSRAVATDQGTPSQQEEEM